MYGVSLHGKRDTADVVKLKTLRWRDYAGFLALEMEEGSMSQGKQMASESWKNQGNGFFHRASRKKSSPNNSFSPSQTPEP